jgi:predicted PurR-regulated permease PerM
MQQPVNHEGVLSRARASALVLIVATGVLVYLCYRLIEPFLPALAWALALAVVAQPFHRRLTRIVPFPNLAAGLSTVIVAVIVLGPALFVTHQLVQQGTRYARTIEGQLESGQWRERLSRNPVAARVLSWIDSPGAQDPGAGQRGQKSDDNSTTGNQESSDASPVDGIGPALTRNVTGGVTSFVGGTIWIGMQLFITLMALFFFLRDRQPALAKLRSLLPLAHSEADEVFARVDNTIRATVFGSLVVALIQGCMGGLMFWWLGLPAPLVWGAIMALLAVVPVLGSSVVWLPAAIILAIQGEWMKAAVLVTWGAVAIGLIDNFLYPFIVGKRIHFHTLLVFLAIVGGLALFGASGIVLGPLVLAILDALIDVWRRRTAHGGVLEEKPAP